MIQFSDSGRNIFQLICINWLQWQWGMIVLIMVNMQNQNYILMIIYYQLLVMKGIGDSQLLKNSKDSSVYIRQMVMYFLVMNSRQGVEEYLIICLVISFDFVLVRLNGGWLVLVSVEMKNKMIIGRCGSQYQFNRFQLFFCVFMILVRFIEFEEMMMLMMIRFIEILQEIICEVDRSEVRNGYFEFEVQLFMIVLQIFSDEVVKMNRMLILIFVIIQFLLKGMVIKVNSVSIIDRNGVRKKMNLFVLVGMMIFLKMYFVVLVKVCSRFQGLIMFGLCCICMVVQILWLLQIMKISDFMMNVMMVRFCNSRFSLKLKGEFQNLVMIFCFFFYVVGMLCVLYFCKVFFVVIIVSFIGFFCDKVKIDLMIVLLFFLLLSVWIW